jgi:hypothetical protein
MSNNDCRISKFVIRHSIFDICFLLSAAVALPTPAAAQQPTTPRRSQPGSVMQRVGDTKIEILYSRPVARGRELFGKVVPWGRVWNPGADTATQVSFSDDVRVNGARLAAGTYSLWAMPGPETWTVIFSRAAPVWHLPYPGQDKDALRLEVRSETGSHMEALAYYFPVVDGLRAMLHLHWGTTIVPLEIEAEQ